MQILVLVLIFFTGFSGLVYQVTWQRYLSYLLGGEALSSALVVSIFLGGLALGYELFGRWAKGKSASQLVKAAGIAEVGIGIWTFCFPNLFDLIWANLDAFPSSQPARATVDLILSILLISPATILMGSTLPLLTSGLAHSKEDLSRIHSQVYGVNTLGAFLGSLLAGFYLVGHLGLPLTLICLSAVNILAGAAIYLIGGRLVMGAAVARPSTPKTTGAAVRRLVLVFAFLVGAVSIGFEIVFIRSVSLSVGSSEYSYALVVGVFVMMIAIGTLSLPKKIENSAGKLIRNQLGITVGLTFVYLTVPYWGWLNYVVRNSLASIPSNFAVYHVLIFLLLSLLISIPVFFMGRAMPLLFSSLRSERAGAAGNVGKIYAANTLGCCLGGVAMGYLLLLHWDADVVYRVGIFFSAISVAFALVLSGSTKLKVSSRWAPAALLVLASVALPSWPKDLMPIGLYRLGYSQDAYDRPSSFLRRMAAERKVLSYRDDPNTNVSVIESTGGVRSLFVNGKSDGSDERSDVRIVTLIAHLPALFAPQGEAAVVGLGLGGTAYAAASFSSISHVDVFEIAEGVIRAQPFFGKVNHNILANPKVSILQTDAFRGLLASKKKYGVIISEPSNPWVSGIDRLFTKEFYEIVKSRLRADGTFAQWIHAYEISVPTFNVVIRTFAEAFPNHRIFRLDNSDLILLGSAQPWNELRMAAAEARWREEPAVKDLLAFDIRQFGDLGFLEMPYAAPVAKGFQMHSLFFPKLSYMAGKDFFMRKSVDLPEHLSRHPVLHLSRRMQWKGSIVHRAIQNDPMFGGRVLDFCQYSPSGLRPFLSLPKDCQAQVLGFFFSAKGKPVPADSHLVEMLEALREVSSGRDFPASSSLGLKKLLLSIYPVSATAPSAKVLTRFHACDSGEGPECTFSLIDDYIRFGHLEAAQKTFAEFTQALAGRSSEADARIAEAGLVALTHISQAMELVGGMRASQQE